MVKLKQKNLIKIEMCSRQILKLFWALVVQLRMKSSISGFGVWRIDLTLSGGNISNISFSKGFRVSKNCNIYLNRGTVQHSKIFTKSIRPLVKFAIHQPKFQTLSINKYIMSMHIYSDKCFLDVWIMQLFIFICYCMEQI